jgi:hypothetical protein
LPNLEAGGSAPLGEVYAFISSLYFRGKRTYALLFARPPGGVGGIWVVTATRGLVPVDTPVSLADLRELAAGSIEPDDDAYRSALIRTARVLRTELGECETVLLGSIASARYVEPLLEVFGARLSVPETFAGRGDMSRGGLLLRCAATGEELFYAPAEGATRHGARPPKLDPLTRPRGGPKG